MATGQTAPVQVYPRQLAPRQISTRTSVLTGQMARDKCILDNWHPDMCWCTNIYQSNICSGPSTISVAPNIVYLYLPIHMYTTSRSMQPQMQGLINCTYQPVVMRHKSTQISYQNGPQCNYMIFFRSKTQFSIRLTINDQTIERILASKLLGLWIHEDISWTENCKEICQKSYSRISMIRKLKYVGVNIENLIFCQKFKRILLCSIPFNTN